jgi:hypothetical protein
MLTIRKYTLYNREESIPIPYDSKIIHVDHYNSIPAIWVEIDTERHLEIRHFHIYFDGEELPVDFPVGSRVHVGSVKPNSTMSILHVYERFPPNAKPTL